MTSFLISDDGLLKPKHYINFFHVKILLCFSVFLHTHTHTCKYFDMQRSIQISVSIYRNRYLFLSVWMKFLTLNKMKWWTELKYEVVCISLCVNALWENHELISSSSYRQIVGQTGLLSFYIYIYTERFSLE